VSTSIQRSRFQREKKLFRRSSNQPPAPVSPARLNDYLMKNDPESDGREPREIRGRSRWGYRGCQVPLNSGDTTPFFTAIAFGASLVVPCSGPGRSASQRLLQRLHRPRAAPVRAACRRLFIGPSSAARRNPSQSVTSPRSARSVTRASYSAIPFRMKHVDRARATLRDMVRVAGDHDARQTSHRAMPGENGPPVNKMSNVSPEFS